MRCIAPSFYKNDGVRVNAICPGTVKTNLLEPTAWSGFSDDVFVPIEKIASTVLMLIDGFDVDGKSIGDGKPLGDSTKGQVLNGKAVEISGTNHYYRDQVAFSDAQMEKTMSLTNRDTYQS